MKTFAAILLAASMTAGIEAASASPMTFTYTGTVAFGMDFGGFFGPAGENLAGESFSFVQTIDPAKATAAFASPYYSTSSGGGDYSRSKLQIGTSAFYDITGATTYSYSSSGAHASWLGIGHSDWKGGLWTAEYTYAGFLAFAPSLSADDQPTAITFNTPVYGGYFSTYQASLDTRTWAYDERLAYAGFNLQSLTVAATSTVPLPASAPMFGAALLVLGAFGYGLKRKHESSDRSHVA